MALSVATQTQADRLRRDVDANTTSLPDADVDALFTEAMESYTDAASIAAYTRVLFLQSLLASSAKLTTYRQNESQENASDIFKHIQQLLAYWQGATATAIAATSSAARFGRTTVKPARVKEYPGWL
jgi:hypothetical protein